MNANVMKTNGKNRLLAAALVLAMVTVALIAVIPAADATEYSTIPSHEDATPITADQESYVLAENTEYVINGIEIKPSEFSLPATSTLYIDNGGKLNINDGAKADFDGTVYISDESTLILSSMGMSFDKKCSFNVAAGGTLNVDSGLFKVNFNVIGKTGASESNIIELTQGIAKITGLNILSIGFTAELDGVADLLATSVTSASDKVYQAFGSSSNLTVGSGSELTIANF